MSNVKRHLWRATVAVSLMAAAYAHAADWPTHRGNAQRTGNIDNKPGPKAPKVLWVYDSQEHFIAAPVPGNKELFVSGLGAFNTAAFHALALDEKAPQRELWSKRPPALKLPVVCPPAVVDGKLVLGDGMHQTDGATLYCLTASGGQALWQYSLPGALIHLEGGPTVANGKVFIGGGNAGVLCVDLNRVLLNGQEQDMASVQRIIEATWKEMTARYEEEKKKDPDFAIPPSEDALPKPAPRRLWQAGEGKWHVDAPIAVVGQRVLAASAKLDEKDNHAGDCAMYCVDANSGQLQWRAALELNPWAGPTVAGSTVLTGCSNIRFDPKTIPAGKGQVVALKLEDGAVLWKKNIPGGVISPVAAANDLAILAATDGKVRGLSLKDGQEKWTYDAGAAFFAAPAVVGSAVYVADLAGVVHAVSLADGKALWTLSLATDPAVKAPGMVYSSPIVHDGRVYLGTCNLEGPADQQRTVVVCIGEK